MSSPRNRGSGVGGVIGGGSGVAFIIILLDILHFPSRLSSPSSVVIDGVLVPPWRIALSPSGHDDDNDDDDAIFVVYVDVVVGDVASEGYRVDDGRRWDHHANATYVVPIIAPDDDDERWG
jgi:hypothetical protein